MALCAAAASLLIGVCPGFAGDIYTISPGSDVIGGIRYYTAKYEDTLLDIARDNDLGYNEIISANPGLDPWIPGEGAKVLIPEVWVLPKAQKTGIVLNLAEMRLFRYFEKDGSLMVETHPVGVGREGALTELGLYEITEKEKDPSWYPPASIRKEDPELPAVVPPGPDNPLGTRKMRLGYTSYMMHGTNRPWGVGRRVSHGCIRLYPEDVEKFYDNVKIGEKVDVIYQPFKLGVSGDRVVAEFHEDYLKHENHFSHAVQEVIRRGLIDRVDLYVLLEAANTHMGVPVDVTATEQTRKP